MACHGLSRHVTPKNPTGTSALPGRRQKAATTFYIGTTLLRVGCLIPVLFFLIGSNMCEAPIDRGAGRSYPKVWKAENGISGIHEFRAELCKIYGEPPCRCNFLYFLVLSDAYLTCA